MAQPDATSSVTLRDYVNVIWLRKWLVVIVIVAFTATSFLLADRKTPVSSPKPVRSAAIGLGVGLLAGITLACVVGLFDTRVRTRARAGEILGLPVVGHVPHLPRGLQRDGTLVALMEPEGSAA